jgi:hypothetical protein
MAVTSDEQDEFAAHLALDAALRVGEVWCLGEIGELGQ